MHPSQAETLADNADLLTEIFLRLPAKSLLRFKSVSKQWKSLISCTSFTSAYRSTTSGVLIHRPSKSVLEFAFLAGESSYRRNPSHLAADSVASSVRVLQACNGLVLCSVRRGPRRRTLHVCNPTTGAFSSPPESPEGLNWTNLVFDPTESPHHQLISIANSSNKLHRYSSATGAWSPLPAPNFRSPFPLVLSGGVYWRGALHWLAPNSTTQDSFYLNLSQGRLDPIPAAPDPRRKRRQSSLESAGGRLLLVEVYEEGEIRVSEMMEGYAKWEVRYEIKAIEGVSEVYPQVFGRVEDGVRWKVYCKVQVCCVVGTTVVMRIPGKVLGYGLESGKVWEMGEVVPSSQNSSDFEWVDVFPYIETLACV